MQIQAQGPGPVEGRLLAVGLDVAKRAHVAATATLEGAVGKELSFRADRAGFERLVELIESRRGQSGTERVVVGLEPTGHYWFSVARYLEERGLQVAFVNAAHTKRVKELEDNSPDKNDQKDARVVADLVLRGKTLKRAPCTGVFADLRELGRLRHRLVVERTGCVNRMHRILDVVFPELQRLLPGIQEITTQIVLSKAVTAGDFLRLSKRRLSRILRDASGRKLGADKAGELLAAAERSVGIEEGAEGRRLEMGCLLSRWKELTMQTQEIEERLEVLLKEVPYAGSLLAVRGLGVVTVSMVLGEAGDLRCYHTGAALLKMAGLNLYSFKSGSKRGSPRITKRGRPLLRHAAYLAAVGMVRTGGPLEPFYRRLRGNGVEPTEALVAASCKLLRVMFAMVRDDMEFDEELLGTSGSITVACGRQG